MESVAQLFDEEKFKTIYMLDNHVYYTHLSFDLKPILTHMACSPIRFAYIHNGGQTDDDACRAAVPMGFTAHVVKSPGRSLQGWKDRGHGPPWAEHRSATVSAIQAVIRRGIF